MICSYFLFLPDLVLVNYVPRNVSISSKLSNFLAYNYSYVCYNPTYFWSIHSNNSTFISDFESFFLGVAKCLSILFLFEESTLSFIGPFYWFSGLYFIFFYFVLISFLLLTLALICSFFSFLRCKVKLFTWDYSFSIYAFIAINLPPRTALALSH